jgi:hypothetical protein
MELHDSEYEDSVTIIPVELSLMFWASLTKGFSTRFGPTQEVAFEWMTEFWQDWKDNAVNKTFLLQDASDSFKVDIKPCQYVFGENLMRNGDG